MNILLAAYCQLFFGGIVRHSIEIEKLSNNNFSSRESSFGAQVNAFSAEGIQKTPQSIAGLVHKETSRDEKPAEEQHVQATPDHKHDMDNQGQKEQR